jgi:hypothetical protein|tara:strand:- start:99 stop:1004 length:906 start_codon:yes stop_codon:yes gene_type:complete
MNTDTNVMTIDTNNFAVMAKAMGMASENDTKKKSSTLARLRISHTPIMGQQEINGKKVNVEIVEGGTYKLEVPDGETYFSTTITLRPFMQRYMYKRWVTAHADSGHSGAFIKTVMNDNLNVDLKDNDGNFNCGKPTGYIKDFKALPQSTQDMVRTIKRVRVIFGMVEFGDAVNSSGESVDTSPTPFIWEVDNRDAFKTLGECFTKLAKMKRLPPQHNIECATEERKLPNGNSYYVPSVALNLTDSVTLTQEDQDMFGNFIQWVDNYNDYIINAWNEKSRKVEEIDNEVVDEIIDSEEIPFE